MMNDNYAKINNVCLVILTAIAVTGALYFTQSVLLPFVISIFIYSVASPSIRILQDRLRFPRILAILAAVFVYSLATAILIFFVTNSLDSFIRSAGAYRDRIVDFIQWGTQLAESYGFEVEDRPLREEIRNLPIFSWMTSLTGNAVSFMGNSTLIFIFVIFLITGEGQKKSANEFFIEIQSKVSQYIVTKGLVSCFTGVLVGILLLICGLELTFMFVVLTVLLNFIPSIGSIIATLLPLPVVLLQFGFTWPFYVILIGSSLIQFTIGNIVEPKFLGDSMDLHPVTVLMSLMFWALVWGLPGMFLGVPITAVFKIILSRIETTRGFSELLAGRFPKDFNLSKE